MDTGNTTYSLFDGEIPIYHLYYANRDAEVGSVMTTSVHPGTAKTPLLDLIEDVEKLTSMFPVGHLGEAEDIAYGILHLASDESKFTTGTELIIDGGFTAQ